MKPVETIERAEAQRLAGLLFDLDDTLLTHGELTKKAYDALHALHEGGLALVAVTGRPCGWGRVLVRQWPVSGCITENGAVHVVRDGNGIALRESVAPDVREARRAKLAELVDRVHAIVPEARLTDDIDLRRSDITWDVGERAVLPPDRTRIIVRAIESAGARWSISSVHLHATFDADDKASGAVRFCARELGCEPSAVPSRFAFVGDSGNDAPCFGAFRTTFGVANVRASVARLSVPPRYVTRGTMGEGFAELAYILLDKRGNRPKPTIV